MLSASLTSRLQKYGRVNLEMCLGTAGGYCYMIGLSGRGW